MDFQGRHHVGGTRRHGSRPRLKGMLLAMAAALFALLLVPTVGQASIETIGPPNLGTFQATVSASSPEDDLFTLIAEGAQTAGYAQPPGAMPADGQVIDVKVEGGFLTPAAPEAAVETEVHIQDLTHVSGGSDGNPGTWQVHVTSQPFPMFTSANATDLSSHLNDFKPENLCVHKGDLVDLNSEGGFEPKNYPQGVPLQAFASVPNAVTGFFRGNNQTMNTANVTLGQLAPPNSTQPNAMLLMQVQLATESDIGVDCKVNLHLPLTGGGVGGGGGLVATVGAETVSPTAFPAAPSGPSALAARRRYGTKVSFTLNQAGSVRFTVVQPQAGRKARGRRCLKPTRANRKARACTRLVAIGGSFTVAGNAGANSFRFTGRLAGRKLKPGKYQLVATPIGGGKTGTAASVSFAIVK
jgi:hypothetical protein